MGSVFDFLKEEQDGRGVEEMTFAPSGFVGKVMARNCWCVYSETDITTHADIPDGAWRDGRMYYHMDEEAMKVMKKLAEAKYYSQAWHFQFDENSVVNNVDVSKFEYGISSMATVASLERSSKRHEFHFITLPMAVQAIALKYGYLKSHIFNIDELLMRELEITPEFTANMIGGKYTRNGEDVIVHYKDSELWARRALLWEELGETDLMKYEPIGDQYTHSVTSEKLSECLRIFTYNWPHPLWARFLLVKNPVKWTLPAIYEFFDSENEAKKAVGYEENNTEGGDDNELESSPDSGGLSIPSEWIGLDDKWKEYVKELKDTHGELPKLPPRRAELLKELSEVAVCKPSELEAWWNNV